MKKAYFILIIFALVILNSCDTKEKIKENTIEVESNPIVLFLKNNESVTEESYKELFELIRKDYANNIKKYNIVIHIAKKTLKEKDSIMKNKLYKNLKTEYLKIIDKS